MRHRLPCTPTPLRQLISFEPDSAELEHFLPVECEGMLPAVFVHDWFLVPLRRGRGPHGALDVHLKDAVATHPVPR